MNVKLCGLSSSSEIEHAARVGATHVGLVVQAPESHRNLTLEEASELAGGAPASVSSVLVSPTDEAEQLAQALQAVGPDVVQASGEIAPDELLTVSQEADVEVWKAVGLARKVHLTVDRVDAYAEADAVVLDALTEGYGGHGDVIDWGHAFEVACSVNVPIVLAGGLTPDNVAEAIRQVDPWCVDVSSGIETDEAKDEAKMEAFLEAVQAEEQR